MDKSQEKSNLKERPPVVGVFGHIDHGKSTLLDYIRETNVVEGEAGGITQHISAYEIRHKREGQEQKITFLDTPGHEAFSGIRSRGALVADIAVLVVSGEDGVKPQTLEVYKHIRDSSLPLIVAVTKMDKPGADLEKTKGSLAEAQIFVEGFGGTVPIVPLSAKTGQGVSELLDMISLMAEMSEFKGEEDALGSGIIIESKLDPKRGITTVAIIKNGTVRKGTFAASQGAVAPLRYILNMDGKPEEELSFSSPIQIIGWDKMPSVGDKFQTFLKKGEAEEFSKKITVKESSAETTTTEGIEILPIIIKADAAGSLEAAEDGILKLSRERILPKIISSGMGPISENDVKLAITTKNAVVFAFHSGTDNAASALALRTGINIESFNIIYELVERVAKILEEREPRIEVEETLGTAKVLKLFGQTKTKQILGARVISGKMTADSNLKILRREMEIGRGKLKELQQAKVKTSEVAEGAEFGAMVESKIEIAPGDTLEAVILVTK